MKLRIQGDSLRLRLNQDEVARMGAEGEVQSQITFGPHLDQRLVYALEASDGAAELEVRYRPGRLVIVLPRAWVEDWVGTERVGFQAEVAIQGGAPLRVLVEKDFACLHREEEEEDPLAYPHPAAV